MQPEIIEETMIPKPIDGKVTAQEHIDLGNFLKAKGATDADVTQAIGLSPAQNRRGTADRLRAWLRKRPKAKEI